MITIKNKLSGQIFKVETGYRKCKKVVKLDLGVALAIEGKQFKKYWELVN